jgi:cytochrome o ubiquinol oxidase operon protein cyoD
MKYHKGLLKSYIIGFVLSIVLTLLAYYPVLLNANSHHMMFPRDLVLWFIIALAFIQLLVQLFFFLHLGQEEKPRWKLAIMISFFGIVLIVVIASIWIMQHLNYNMSLIQLDRVMQQGEGF